MDLQCEEQDEPNKGSSETSTHQKNICHEAMSWQKFFKSEQIQAISFSTIIYRHKLTDMITFVQLQQKDLNRFRSRSHQILESI